MSQTTQIMTPDSDDKDYEKGTNPNLPRPAPPIIGKVTHHSVELYWDDTLEKAMAVCDRSEGRVRVCLQEHDRGGEWGNLYSPETSFRTKKQLKCFWKNEKMRAKEELLNYWKTDKPKDGSEPRTLSQTTQSVCSIIPDKIRSLENSLCEAEEDAGAETEEIKIKQEIVNEQLDQQKSVTPSSWHIESLGSPSPSPSPLADTTPSLSLTSVTLNSPVTLTSPVTSPASFTSASLDSSVPSRMVFRSPLNMDSIPALNSPSTLTPQMSLNSSQMSLNPSQMTLNSQKTSTSHMNMKKSLNPASRKESTDSTGSYESFLRLIAETEHHKKMEIYELKKEVLILKKRKLEQEVNESAELAYLQECANKKRKLEQLFDKA